MQKKSQQKRSPSHAVNILREGSLFLFIAIAAYLFVALFTYTTQDPGWASTGKNALIQNQGGRVGAYLADLFFQFLGYAAFLAPAMVALHGWAVYSKTNRKEDNDYATISVRWLGFVITLSSGTGLLMVSALNSQNLPSGAGGILGDFVSIFFIGAFSQVGAIVLLFALFLSGITLCLNLSWSKVLDFIGEYSLKIFFIFAKQLLRLKDLWLGYFAKQERQANVVQKREELKEHKPIKIQPRVEDQESSERAEKEKQIPLFASKGSKILPPISILDSPDATGLNYSDNALTAMSKTVELKLKDFGIEAEVVNVVPGPIITRFEIQLAAGVKVSKISNLSKDLARALAVESVRIVEVIPGKPVIGLEIPNENRETVLLKEILESQEYENSSSPLTLALGKDTSGQAVITDLGKMPHLLIAGTTGSGKSVAVNAMILSLLYKSSAAEVRMVLIDPKMIELNIYEGIPHLLTPVVTDMKEAANALSWAVGEMERRYKIMSVLGVRNLEKLNQKVASSIKDKTPIANPIYNEEIHNENESQQYLDCLPHIVIVVDEFADMMMFAGKRIEQLINRLANKARAAGIHLVLATQRPSVDVITGLIKANIPARIAFQVSSKIDSRTILDQMGAEQLLGHGDMLFIPPGTTLSERIHGAYVADHEVHNVVSYLKEQGEADYLDDVLVEQDETSAEGVSTDGSGENTDMDPLYEEAVTIVTETRKASISYLQRRLKIGYNRAARMIEDMESSGIVSEVQANGVREVVAPSPKSSGI